MGAGAIGVVIGGFAVAILLPVIILIICNFIPAAKRNPKIVYGICVVLAILAALAGVNGGTPIELGLMSAVLAVAFLVGGYYRAEHQRSGRAVSLPDRFSFRAFGTAVECVPGSIERNSDGPDADDGDSIQRDNCRESSNRHPG